MKENNYDIPLFTHAPCLTDSYEYKGIVSGYSIANSEIDLLGRTVKDDYGRDIHKCLSNIYICEKKAIKLAKEQAMAIGANAIYGVSINLIADGNGHGGLFSVTGTAVYVHREINKESTNEKILDLDKPIFNRGE